MAVGYEIKVVWLVWDQRSRITRRDEKWDLLYTLLKLHRNIGTVDIISLVGITIYGVPVSHPHILNTPLPTLYACSSVPFWLIYVPLDVYAGRPIRHGGRSYLSSSLFPLYLTVGVINIWWHLTRMNLCLCKVSYIACICIYIHPFQFMSLFSFLVLKSIKRV